MLKELQDFGLSEKEAKVYVASLEVGRATAEQLAKKANVNRSTTYVQLELLMKKGLVSTFEEGKKTFFVPESPDTLRRLLEKQKEEVSFKENELERLLPDLIKQFDSAGERPQVRFFTGKEGITAMREETLQLKAGEVINIIYCLDSLVEIYALPELKGYTKRRVEKGIKVRQVYTKKKGPLEKNDITDLAERRFIPYEKMPLTSDFFVFGNKVAVMALGAPIFGIVIESKEIADSMRVFFNLLWSIGVEDK